LQHSFAARTQLKQDFSPVFLTLPATYDPPDLEAVHQLDCAVMLYLQPRGKLCDSGPHIVSKPLDG